MKNANRTAYPHHSQTNDNNFGGLTKREMFAMNAPEIPEQFIDDFIYNDGNYRLGGQVEVCGHNRVANLDKLEVMRMLKEWRYAYADLMLDDKQY